MNGVQAIRPMAHTRASALGLVDLHRRADSAPSHTPTIPAAQVMIPNVKLTLWGKIIILIFLRE